MIDSSYYLRSDIEQKEDWRGWIDKIPAFNFPLDWNVKIIPPFGGAMVRFLVEKGTKKVSIYLDCFDRLGFMMEPYWEVYPLQEETFRCKMSETKELLEAIEQSLNE